MPKRKPGSQSSPAFVFPCPEELALSAAKGPARRRLQPLRAGVVAGPRLQPTDQHDVRPPRLLLDPIEYFIPVSKELDDVRLIGEMGRAASPRVQLLERDAHQADHALAIDEESFELRLLWGRRSGVVADWIFGHEGVYPTSVTLVSVRWSAGSAKVDSAQVIADVLHTCEISA